MRLLTPHYPWWLALFGSALLAAAPPAVAITLPLTDFPQAIQDGVAAGATLNTSTGLDSNGRSAFPYVPVGGSVEWLLRYPLDPASSRVAATDDGSGTWTTVTTPLTGYIWLEAPDSMPPDPFGPALTQVPFTLYTDFVTPTPDNLWFGGDRFAGNGSPNLPVTMPSADAVAVAGHASRRIGLDFYNGDYDTGTLRTVGYPGGEGLLPCLDDTCEVSAELNLVGLDYSLGGPPFNPVDPTALLYRQNSQYFGSSGWNTTQSYYVAPVPEPVSLLLLAPCLALLVVRRRA